MPHLLQDQAGCIHCLCFETEQAIFTASASRPSRLHCICFKTSHRAAGSKGAPCNPVAKAVLSGRGGGRGRRHVDLHQSGDLFENVLLLVARGVSGAALGRNDINDMPCWSHGA